MLKESDLTLPRVRDILATMDDPFGPMTVEDAKIIRKWIHSLRKELGRMDEALYWKIYYLEGGS